METKNIWNDFTHAFAEPLLKMFLTKRQKGSMTLPKVPKPILYFPLPRCSLKRSLTTHTDEEKLCVTRQQSLARKSLPCFDAARTGMPEDKDIACWKHQTKGLPNRLLPALTSVYNPNIVLLAICQCVTCFCHHYPVNHLFYTSGTQFIAMAPDTDRTAVSRKQWKHTCVL